MRTEASSVSFTQVHLVLGQPLAHKRQLSKLLTQANKLRPLHVVPFGGLPQSLEDEW